LREKALAEEAFERSLRLNPNDPDANHNYAWFLCENKREEESIRYFLMAVRHPLYATPQKSYAMAAECAMRKNNERDAHDYLERALRLDPNYYPALISLAQLKYGAGNSTPRAHSSVVTTRSPSRLRNRCGLRCGLSAKWATLPR